MAEILKHKMWLKQFLKGFAERVPEEVWQKIAERLYVELPGDIKTKIDKVENLNEAYTLGHVLSAVLFGGRDEPS